MVEALLQDRRILVVEDEFLIAESMSRSLRKAGAVVLGPVGSVSSALAILEAESRVDAAVLDINLGDERVYPVADVLLARGAPYVFATGNDPADVPTAYAAVTRCDKPVDHHCIVHALLGIGLASSNEIDFELHSLEAIRDQLLRQLTVITELNNTLLAAKICEALDVVDAQLAAKSRE